MLKESLANHQKSSESALKQHLDNFSVERSSMLDKIEKLNQNLSKKEIELISANNKLDDFKKAFDKQSFDSDSSKYSLTYSLVNLYSHLTLKFRFKKSQRRSHRTQRRK